jgi:hypothetical protein
MDKRNSKVIFCEALNDSSLSWEARGLYAFLASNADEYGKLSVDFIRENGLSGRDKVRKMFKELVNAGYLRRYWIKDQGRMHGTGYEFYNLKEDNPDYKNICSG